MSHTALSQHCLTFQLSHSRSISVSHCHLFVCLYSELNSVLRAPFSLLYSIAKGHVPDLLGLFISSLVSGALSKSIYHWKLEWLIFDSRTWAWARTNSWSGPQLNNITICHNKLSYTLHWIMTIKWLNHWPLHWWGQTTFTIFLVHKIYFLALKHICGIWLFVIWHILSLGFVRFDRTRLFPTSDEGLGQESETFFGNSQMDWSSDSESCHIFIWF